MGQKRPILKSKRINSPPKAETIHPIKNWQKRPNFKCIKCDHAYGQFAEMIDHMTIRHPQADIITRKLFVNAAAKPFVMSFNVFIYSMHEKETIRIAKLNPTNDCPYIIDTKPVLDNPINRKSNCVACDLPFTSQIKTTQRKAQKQTACLDIVPKGIGCLVCLCLFKFCL